MWVSGGWNTICTYPQGIKAASSCHLLLMYSPFKHLKVRNNSRDCECAGGCVIGLCLITHFTLAGTASTKSSSPHTEWATLTWQMIENTYCFESLCSHTWTRLQCFWLYMYVSMFRLCVATTPRWGAAEVFRRHSHRAASQMQEVTHSRQGHRVELWASASLSLCLKSWA